ncbi:MAG: hypothetical protein JW951_07685 [Lentisphaerae bacterium]|nr:hypothetical protein [Lentisphaerota bacterium]
MPEVPAEDDAASADGADAGGVLAEARTLFDAGRYEEALIACVEAAAAHPRAEGLPELRTQILGALAEQRLLRAQEDAALTTGQMTADALEQEVLPETFRLKRFVNAEVTDHATPAGPMRQALDGEVSIHLQGADLSAIMDALSRDANINMIADQGMGKGKALDVQLDKVPLREVLDYVSRNFDVQFYLGENVIWITNPDKVSSAPLETRIYRLHKGLQFHGSDWGADDAAKPSPATRDRPLIAFRATELSTAKSYIEEVIDRFVPAVEGAQLHLDRNTHTLMARNTPDNLEMIEEIIKNLDVTPPQVLIEARFIEVMAADLREIGLDWILDSPLVVSEKAVLQDGTWAEAPQTQVQEGDILQYAPYISDDQGPTPLGPQGAFGEVRQGNPATTEQGLNLTYQGVLTEPMFRAVLHALDISGKSRTLSVPRVATINNNPAKLRDGEDLRFYEEFQAQAFNLLDANNQKYTITVLIPKGKPALEETGVTLVAVPSVGEDRRTISLLLIPTISVLEGFVSYQDESVTNDISRVVVKLPIISRREIQTKVVVESGETVVMGGLISTISQETWHKTPVLSSIPLLGNLFSRLDTTEQRKNLLIFVTATVMSERGESLIAAGGGG